MGRIQLLLTILLCVFICPLTVLAATYSLTWDGDGRTTIDGKTFCDGVCQPGDIIELPSGTTHDSLYINSLHGSAGNPIIIRNKHGQQTIIDTNDVTIAPVYGNGIWIQYSRYVKIDGSNGYDESDNNNLSYGIRITDCANKGMFINQGTQELEIQYLEIDNIGSRGYNNQGIGIKENTKIGEVPEDTTLNGLYIHHNYIHDTGTEAVYLGASGSCGGVSLTNCCNSKDDTDDAVIWNDVRVYQNRTDRTGWDGISSSCSETALIYNNTITNAGLGNFTGIGQGNGLSLNKGFGGAAYGNKIIGTQKQGISWQGTGDTDVYNNLIVNVGNMSTAPYYERVGFDDAGGADSANLSIRYNTFVNIPYEALRIDQNQRGEAQDNLFVSIGTANRYGSLSAANPGVTKSTISECYFKDALNNNYDLTPFTPRDIKAAGQTSGYPSTDLEGARREIASPADIGAYSTNDPGPPAPWLSIKSSVSN